MRRIQSIHEQWIWILYNFLVPQNTILLIFFQPFNNAKITFSTWAVCICYSGLLRVSFFKSTIYTTVWKRWFNFTPRFWKQWPQKDQKSLFNQKLSTDNTAWKPEDANRLKNWKLGPSSRIIATLRTYSQSKYHVAVQSVTVFLNQFHFKQCGVFDREQKVNIALRSPHRRTQMIKHRRVIRGIKFQH